MTRRNFFRSALACFGAMVLAPVRTVEPSFRRVPLIGCWDRKVRESPIYLIDWGEMKVVALRGHWTRG